MAGGFDSLGLMPELIRGVEEMGWLLPTDVQDEAIPLILGGGDVMVASETGSGKTASFGLPVLQCVHERLRAADLAREKNSAKKSGPYNVRISANDKDSILVVDERGMSCSNTAQKQWAGARASHGVRGGKYYFECNVRGNGICRVGWSTMSASLELGKDTHGYGYGGTSKKSSGNNFEDYGEKYGDGDCIGCFLDMEGGIVSFSKNGTDLGQAFTISESDKQAVMFPAVLLKDCGVTFQFGADRFQYPPPSTISSLHHGGSPGEVVEATSDELHMQATTDGSKRKPLALILLPTKILAKQVMQCNISLAAFLMLFVARSVTTSLPIASSSPLQLSLVPSSLATTIKRLKRHASHFAVALYIRKY